MNAEETYVYWLTHSTKTDVWNDSANPQEILESIVLGANGATTNPFLAHQALERNKDIWAEEIEEVRDQKLSGDEKAEALMKIPVTHAAQQFYSIFQATQKERGYVCAQVNPEFAHDREVMYKMAKRFNGWAPNIAVKLPATAAGLDVLEDCIAEGITCTVTISYSVSQAVAIAERYRKGIRRAGQKEHGRCFSVLMIGRLDDYLRDLAECNKINLRKGDIEKAGIAVAKHANRIYQEKGYEAVLLPAALRYPEHVTELAGANMIISMTPDWQSKLNSENPAREERIGQDTDKGVMKRLLGWVDFRRVYEPDGMKPDEFYSWTCNERTRSVFFFMGWQRMMDF